MPSRTPGRVTATGLPSGSTDLPPSVPTGLTASAVSANEIDLTWTASTDSDSTGVTGHHVLRNGAQIATVSSGTSYKDQSVSPSTQYSYTVSPCDTANNGSAQSSPAVATTRAGGGGGGGGDAVQRRFREREPVEVVGVQGGVVQTAIVSSGTHAARATTTGSPRLRSRRLRPAQPTLLRLRFNVQSQGSTSMYLLRLRAAPNSPMMGLYIGSTGILCYRNEQALTNSCSSVSPSKGAWHTALLHVIVNGSTSTVEVWLDRTKLITKTDNLGTTGVGRIELGDSASGKTFDVALDDVVVDTNPLTP
jgi:chitodextrinase